MSTTTCLHCGATTTNGLVLCDLSQMKAAQALEFIPVYFRNLARWRPGRAGSRSVPGSRVLYDGTDRDPGGDRISRALDEAGAAITDAAEQFQRARGAHLPDVGEDEAQTITALCRYLAEHLTAISVRPMAGAFVTQLAEHEETLRRLTEDVAPGWYAGGCQRCDSGTYVVPGLTWVRCRGCGVTTYARDHLDSVLDEAREWIAQPKAIATAIVALVDGEDSVPQLHGRIRQWSARGRITGVRRTDTDGDEVGPKRYRLGDVLDLLLTPQPVAVGHADATAS